MPHRKTRYRGPSTKALDTEAAFDAVADGIPADLAAAIPELAPTLDDFSTAVAAVNGRAVARRWDEADRLRVETLEPAYVHVEAALAEARDLVTGWIASNETTTNLTAQMMRLVVTLLIPATALIGYWLIARRQVRDSKIELETRLEAEHQMIAGVSHELRTPLTSIYGFSETLLELDMTDPDEIREVVTVINGEAADLTRMVDDLLAVAQIDADKLAVTSIDFRSRRRDRGPGPPGGSRGEPATASAGPA